MDAFVTARVPEEIKLQVSQILSRIGATQTDLVNAAFEFALATGELPRVKSPDEPKHRVIGEETRAKIRQMMLASTVPIPEDAWGGKAYKELMSEWRAADYEALS